MSSVLREEVEEEKSHALISPSGGAGEMLRITFHGCVLVFSYQWALICTESQWGTPEVISMDRSFLPSV